MDENAIYTIGMKTKILNAMISLWFSVLAGDLLYLYFGHHWYDPKPWIEYTEVVCLFIFIPSGIFNAVIELRHLKPPR